MIVDVFSKCGRLSHVSGIQHFTLHYNFVDKQTVMTLFDGESLNFTICKVIYTKPREIRVGQMKVTTVKIIIRILTSHVIRFQANFCGVCMSCSTFLKLKSVGLDRLYN
jgi:hypothetical protein